ncbi:hypothetical protein LCGC14_1041090, partial [marine sediment metagenome]
WYTDPWVRAQRVVVPTARCVGCGAAHSNRNACDDTFSAFCTNACHDANQSEDYFRLVLQGRDAATLAGQLIQRGMTPLDGAILAMLLRPGGMPPGR